MTRTCAADNRHEQERSRGRSRRAPRSRRALPFLSVIAGATGQQFPSDAEMPFAEILSLALWNTPSDASRFENLLLS